MPVSSPERPACSSLASPYQSCDPANSSSWVVLPTSSMPSSDPYFALPAPQSTPTMAPLVDNMSSSTTLMASSELCAHSSDVTSLWYEAIAKYKADTGLYLDAKQGMLFESGSAVYKYLDKHRKTLQASRVGGSTQRLRAALEPITASLVLLCGIAGEGVDSIFKPSKVLFTAVGQLVKAAIDGNELNSIADVFKAIEHHLRVLNHVATRHVATDDALKESSVKLLTRILLVLGVIQKVQKQRRLVLWLRNLADSKEVSSALVNLGRLSSNQNEAVTIVALHAARETLAIFTDSDAWNKEEQAVTRASLASITQIAQDVQAMLRENAALTPDQQSVDRGIVENIQSALLRHIEATSMDKKTADVEKVFAWLQFSDPSVKVNNLLDERAHSTGSWFLDGKEFASFKKGTHKVLWLHGKAGCGKSTMMAAAIQDLKAHAAVSDPPAVVLAHLLDTTNSSQPRDLRTLISSLLCQVAYSKAELATQLLKLRTWFSFGHSQTSLEAMSYGLDVMFDTPDLRFFVVIDALDEVEDEQISLFLQHLRTRANVSLLLSSRPEARFRDNAEGLCDARVSMDDSLVAGDIDIALRHVFHAGGALNEVLDSYMKDAISKAMIAQADGNFRWTRLQLLELVRVAGIPSKMLLSLSRLPETLDETYGRLLGRVLPEDQDDVRRLLIWAIFSHRPLSKTDFAQILSFDYSAPMPVYHASQEPVADNVIALVGPAFISVQNDVARIAHASVKDYILSLPSTSPFHIDSQLAYRLMAQTGLAYVHHALGSACQRSPGYPHHLLWTWVVYVDRAGEGQYATLKQSLPPHFSSNAAEVLAASLHAAAEIGHGALLRWHIEFGADINRPHQRYDKDYLEAPLGRAVRANGSVDVARLSIDLGAVVDGRNGSNHWTSLHRAAEDGHLELARLLVDHGADIEAQEEEGRTPLHLTAEGGHCEVARFLIDKEADVDSRDYKQQTSLHVAARHDCHAHPLIDQSADVEGCAADDWVLLPVAAVNRYLEIARLLLDSGADIDARDKEQKTPLHFASQKGHLEIARLLLNRGVDVDAHEEDDWTPLHLAAYQGHLETARVLIDHGADVSAREKDGWMPLHLVAQEGHLDTARLLIDRGTDVDARTDGQWTSLFLAACCNNLEVSRLLLGRGADVDTRTSQQSTPLHIAAQKGYFETARLLLDVGADANARTDKGSTPLHVVAQANKFEVARLLLDRGADVDARDYQERTPLHLTAENDHLEVARLLIERGADVCASQQDGWTALHFVEKGCLEVAQLLVDRGADVEARDVDGQTPLHAAALDSLDAVVRLLIELGSDVNARANDGQTPLDLVGGSPESPDDPALREGIRQTLLQAGARTSRLRFAETAVNPGISGIVGERNGDNVPGAS